MVTDSGPFPPSALDANRAGSLTDDQRAMLHTIARGVRRDAFNIALSAIVFGIFLFFVVRPGSPVLVRAGIPIGCLFLAVFRLLRSLGGGETPTSDMRNPQVQSLEGPISRQVTQWDSGGPGGGRTDPRVAPITRPSADRYRPRRGCRHGQHAAGSGTSRSPPAGIARGGCLVGAAD